MPRNRLELDEQILKERLPENYREVLTQAETNVNKAVEELIKGYRDNLESLATDLEQGKFDEKFAAEVKKIEDDWQVKMTALDSTAQTLRKSAADLDAAIKANDTPKIQTEAKSLLQSADDLQKRLQEVRDRVKKVGELTGKVAGTALRKFVTSGIG